MTHKILPSATVVWSHSVWRSRVERMWNIKWKITLNDKMKITQYARNILEVRSWQWYGHIFQFTFDRISNIILLHSSIRAYIYNLFNSLALVIIIIIIIIICDIFIVLQSAFLLSWSLHFYYLASSFLVITVIWVLLPSISFSCY